MTELRFGAGEIPLSAEEVVADLEVGHGQAMFGFARRQGLSDDEAQDAVQETLLRLLRELRAKQTIDNPRAWAYRALYRLAMDEHRQRRRLTLLAGRVGGQLDAGQAGRGHLAADVAPVGDRVAVWAAVDALPIRQRQVLYLRYRADLPFEDVGRVMGISSSSARSHATQAMATLRDRLAREDFE